MAKKHGVWVLIFFFGAIYSVFSVVRHLRLESYIYDLGFYDQVIWLESRFKPLFSSINESHAWADHFVPTLLLIAPLYWIWDNTIALLVFQAFFLCLGAYPIYLLAKKKLGDDRTVLVIASVYLMFYGIQNAVAFDFHPIALATTLLAWLFWLYEEKKFKLFWLVLVLLVGLQENLFLLAAAYGIFLIIRYKDFKRGVLIFIGSILFVLLLLFFVMPTFFGSGYRYLPIHLSSFMPLQLIKSVVFPFTKLEVVFFSFLAFGLLPVLSPAVFVMLAEEFLGRFVAMPSMNYWILGFHYNCLLAPILAFGAIEVIQRKFLSKKNFTIGLLLMGVLLSQIRVNTDIKKMFRREYYDLSKTKDSYAILKLIPANASVAATNNLGAQLAHRENLIFLANCLEDKTLWRDDAKRCFKLKPDYLVADLDPEGSRNNLYPDYSRESLLRYFGYLQDAGEYNLVAKRGEVYLLKKAKIN